MYDQGAAGLTQILQRLTTTASVLHVGAHPDDEDSAFLARAARGDHARVAYLALNRGEGGQNIIGPELFDALGVIRTEELLQARRLDGAQQFFTRAFDFGFSKTRSETAALWNEQAVLEDMKLKPEHAKFSAYFNVDNGTGRIRGVFLQGNDRMRPIFEEWFKPLADLGAGTISIRNTGGTDHTSFDAVGLPGFQFIQDPIEYDTRTHHSNMDVYDRVQAADLRQAAAVVASFVYNAATRPDLLPRKPIPAAPPAAAGRGGSN